MSKHGDDLPFDERTRAELEALMAASGPDRTSREPLNWHMVPNPLPDLQAAPVPLDQAVAMDWLRNSLGQGEVISPEALKVMSDKTARPLCWHPRVLIRPVWPIRPPGGSWAGNAPGRPSR